MFCRQCHAESEAAPNATCAGCGHPYDRREAFPAAVLPYQPLDLTRLSPVQQFVVKWDLHPTDQWCRRRWLYRLGLASLFAAIAFYFGPNRILFDKWTSITLDDFIPAVRDRCEPVVRRMKAYRRDHGTLPSLPEDIGLPPHGSPSRMADVNHGEIYCFVGDRNLIKYDFTPGRERWTVSGPFIYGTIPYPAVPDPPATRP